MMVMRSSKVADNDDYEESEDEGGFRNGDTVTMKKGRGRI